MDHQTADQFLIDCFHFDSAKLKAIRLEQLSDIDWVNIIQLSARHGVTPLLYNRLKTLNLVANIPPAIKENLREIYLNNAHRNVRLYYQLAKVLTTFKSNNIPVIVLKGAHLAEIVYRNIALRTMCDVDLLVKKTDLDRVVKELLAIGYNPSRRFWIEAESESEIHLPVFTI